MSLYGPRGRGQTEGLVAPTSWPGTRPPAGVEDFTPPEQQLLNDMRELWRECLEGLRRGDPPAVWHQRMLRIAKLHERLDALEVQQGDSD